MAEPAPTPPAGEPPAGQGVWAETLNLFGSLGRHLQGLFALASLETREAAGIYLRAAIAVVAGLVLAVFGYFLLLFFLAFLLATIFHISWLWISLGFAVLHFAGAAACGFYVKQRVGSPVFRATSAELRRDLGTLQNFKP
jgi:uncharacterized membrane protein YqjE